MKKRFRQALFIFRRDLRLSDNTGLREAQRQAEAVIPAFVFDPRQIGPGTDINQHALRFMIESLDDLQSQLSRQGAALRLFEGLPHTVVQRLVIEERVDAVFVNRDYTPFSVKRDDAIRTICRRHGAEFVSCADTLLNEPETILKKDGTPYAVYTPFARTAAGYAVSHPRETRGTNLFKANISGQLPGIPEPLRHDRSRRSARPGGRTEGLRRLRAIGKLGEYATARNFPARDETTGLSAHLKFGTISVREFFHAVVSRLGDGHPLIGQLHWRDFFSHIAAHFPHVFEGAYHRQFDRLVWNNDPDAFERWCTGETGFPIVDAGMRQLNQTGEMHNRVRMIVASFLIKDLHIDWRRGERYFASKLTDYDPAVNNGNWQWAASTGCDAAPYFRIFNPILQQRRFDPDAEYIRTWVPELAKYDSRAIHRVETSPLSGYSPPMVNHALEAAIARHQYARLNTSSRERSNDTRRTPRQN